MSKYYLKDHVTDEMLVAVGFVKDRFGDFVRDTKRGQISIYRYNKEIDELVRDYSTYTGFKYANEYKHMVRKNIQDLIQLGYVGVRE